MKDNVKSSENVQRYYNRPELNLKGSAKPKTCYTLTKEQRKAKLEWVKDLKLSYGYASN